MNAPASRGHWRRELAESEQYRSPMTVRRVLVGLRDFRRGTLATATVALTFVCVGGSGTTGASIAHRLPAGTARHTSSAAIVAEINAVRKKFGLPPGTATTVYQRAVVSAANQRRDPILGILPPHVSVEDGVWGAITTTGDESTLDTNTIVHIWVYEDGWMGTKTMNVGCTSPSAADCNAHRRAILRRPPKPGAKLAIDPYASTKPTHGTATLSVAAVLSWSSK
jgi:hypothetical protein